MLEHVIIHHKEGQVFERTLWRHAVRGVIEREGLLLLVYCAKVGDYKFPGGGIEARESDHAALAREVREELGFTVSSIGERLARITERRQSKERSNTCFTMISDYYRCEVDDQQRSQNLNAYERDLGFTPVWIQPAQAIERNKLLLASDSRIVPFWLKRDTFMLERLVAKVGCALNC